MRCELDRVHSHLLEKRHDCALLVKDDFLSCPHFARSFKLSSRARGQGMGYRMADPPRLARHMQPQHRQPRRCNPSQLGAAVAASRSASQTHVVTASQARETRELGPQPIKHRPRRQFSGQHGGREVRFSWQHASRQVGNDHRRDLERRRKVSHLHPGLLRCLRPFDRGAYLFSKSDLLIYT